jgi:uncharacterized protein (TIGR03435 family)
MLANTVAQMGNLDRAVIDRTGLDGHFDFMLEWTPQLNGPGTPNAGFREAPSGKAFREDLREQLGLELVPETAVVAIPVIDHAEKP